MAIYMCAICPRILLRHATCTPSLRVYTCVRRTRLVCTGIFVGVYTFLVLPRIPMGEGSFCFLAKARAGNPLRISHPSRSFKQSRTLYSGFRHTCTNNEQHHGVLKARACPQPTLGFRFCRTLLGRCSAQSTHKNHKNCFKMRLHHYSYDEQPVHYTFLLDFNVSNCQCMFCYVCLFHLLAAGRSDYCCEHLRPRQDPYDITCPGLG